MTTCTVAARLACMVEIVTWARALAEEQMAESLRRRWAHVQAVAVKAERLRPALGGEADLLVASAWLHDVGYAEQLQDTGFRRWTGRGIFGSSVLMNGCAGWLPIIPALSTKLSFAGSAMSWLSFLTRRRWRGTVSGTAT